MKIEIQYQQFHKKYGDSLCRYFSRLNLKLMKLLTEEINQHLNISLSYSQYHCLQSICFKGMKQQELAARLGITKQAQSQLLNELNKLGFISKEVDPNDTRSKIIKHTKKGQKCVTEIINASIKLEKLVFKDIGEDNFHILKESLKRIEELKI